MAGFLVASLTGVCFHYLAGGASIFTGPLFSRGLLWSPRFFVDVILLAGSMVIIGVPVGLAGWLISGRERSRRNLLAALSAVLWAFVFPAALALFVDIGISFREPSVLRQVEAWMGLPVAAAIAWRVHRPQSQWG
jgi:hypothetical protein